MPSCLIKYSNELISMFVLLCIFVIYSIDNTVKGVGYFEQQALFSSVFVIILCKIQKHFHKPHLDAIIIIEMLSTATNAIAGLQFFMAHKTAYIYVAYDDIMTNMFLAELAIMVGVFIGYVGIYTKRHSLYLPIRYFSASITSVFSIRKAPLCKIP